MAKKKLVVLDADIQQNQKLCSDLEVRQYRSISTHSLQGLENCLQQREFLVAIIDLDTFPVDNRTLRDLTNKYPATCFLCMSSERFHPHLEEALCNHIYACINKPIDMDELFYLLRSIYENDMHPTNQSRV